MDTAMTLNWLEMRRMSSARVRLDEQTRMVRLARENVRLTDENERLQQQYDALAASAEVWIRLYEAALDRANEATVQCKQLQERLGDR
jgi:ATP-dependent protease HslVU (ClpYQ) ATPase subunit